ncbi:MAG: hypothetical protein ACR2I2_19400 [Bryobacteraceae bacterium]
MSIENGEEAVFWYNRAANQDSPIAWNNLGTIYLHGLQGISADRSRALMCYKRAHELGFDAMDLTSI